METYIQEALASGHIRPSSSPVGAVGLRPCIDYRELNQITVKNKYSLSLISSALDSVQEARVFFKLDIRNAFHLVHMKQGEGMENRVQYPVGTF